MNFKYVNHPRLKRDLVGRYAVLSSPITNGNGGVPAYTLFKINYCYNRAEIRSFKCPTCGHSFSVSCVPYEDLLLLEEGSEKDHPAFPTVLHRPHPMPIEYVDAPKLKRDWGNLPVELQTNIPNGDGNPIPKGTIGTLERFFKRGVMVTDIFPCCGRHFILNGLSIDDFKFIAPF